VSGGANEEPDVEKMAIAAVQAAIPSAEVVNTPPANWEQKLPVIVIFKINGTEIRKGGLWRADLSVAVFHSTKAQAQVVSAQVSTALRLAGLNNFSLTGEGVFTRYRQTKGFVPVADGLSGKHPDSRMIEANVEMTYRPFYV
jgi:hypothetical protein